MVLMSLRATERSVKFTPCVIASEAWQSHKLNCELLKGKRNHCVTYIIASLAQQLSLVSLRAKRGNLIRIDNGST